MGGIHICMLMSLLAITAAFEVSLQDLLARRLLKRGRYIDQQEYEGDLQDYIQNNEGEYRTQEHDGQDVEDNDRRPSIDILGTNGGMARERRQPGGQSAVVPPWSEFCRMLKMRECSRYKRSILKRALLSPINRH